MMLKVLPFLFFLFGNITLCFSQNKTGFYFETASKKNCVHLVRSFDEKNRYCITEKPIIYETEFESISTIEYDSSSHTKSVKLKLSKKGFEAIRSISITFPNTKLLLVVNGKAAGLFNPNGILKQILPISGSIDSPEIDWIVENLRNAGKK